MSNMEHVATSRESAAIVNIEAMSRDLVRQLVSPDTEVFPSIAGYQQATEIKCVESYMLRYSLSEAIPTQQCLNSISIPKTAEQSSQAGPRDSGWSLEDGSSAWEQRSAYAILTPKPESLLSESSENSTELVPIGELKLQA